jgi:hypothetical protein
VAQTASNSESSKLKTNINVAQPVNGSDPARTGSEQRSGNPAITEAGCPHDICFGQHASLFVGDVKQTYTAVLKAGTDRISIDLDAPWPTFLSAFCSHLNYQRALGVALSALSRHWLSCHAICPKTA